MFSLYDSATGTKAPFVPIRPGEVSIYCCGLTVQAVPHLGHIRKEVVFDVLRRWLEWSGYTVTQVTNVTDIDDKILSKAEAAGVPWWAWAYANERELHKAYAALGVREPTYEPRATGHITEMVELIGEIIDAGHAYAADDGSGDVYFDVRSWPDYGELSGQRLDEMEPAMDADPRGKRDPRDFALWKGHKSTEPETASWSSPWGRGRPGWHLECSAMAGKYLGDAFDIHGGGIDLKFPHHENELAQSRAAGRGFARYWMHNAWVTMAGEKMSKSLGNGLAVTEVVKHWPARAVRLYLVGPHYRSSIDYSDAALDEAAASLARVDSFVDRAKSFVDESVSALVSRGMPSTGDESAEGARVAEGGVGLPQGFIDAMDDDLGTPAALAIIHETVREGNKALEAGDAHAVGATLSQVESMLGVFGLRADDPAWVSQGDPGLETIVDGLVGTVLEQRASARARKDYAAADAIRDRLADLGLTIEDTPQGSRWSR